MINLPKPKISARPLAPGECWQDLLRRRTWIGLLLSCAEGGVVLFKNTLAAEEEPPAVPDVFTLGEDKHQER